MNHQSSSIYHSPRRTALIALGMFLLLQFLLFAMGAKPSSRANVWWWTALSTLGADRGFFNVWTPYPPIFTVLHYGLTQLFAGDSQLLARHFFEGDRSPEAKAAYEASFVAMKWVWVVFNIVFLAGQAWLIYRLAQWKLSKQEALIAAAAFLLFNCSWRSQIVIGPGCDQFDYFPSFFFLLGLHWLLREKEGERWRQGDKENEEERSTSKDEHPASDPAINNPLILAAIVTAVGAMIKIYPGLLVPLAWARLGDAKRAAAFTAIVIAICLVIAAPFLYVNSEFFLTTYKWSGTRPGWESVWEYDSGNTSHKPFPPMPVPEAMVGLFDLPFYDVVITLQDGRILPGRIIDKSADRVVLELLDGERQAFRDQEIQSLKEVGKGELKYSLLMLVTLIALLASAWKFRKVLRTGEGLIRGALLFVLILIFFSKGVSSYFLLWFFPFLFILYPPLIACGLFGLFLLVGNFEFFGAGLAWYWPSIFVRQAMFGALAIDQIRRMGKWESTQKQDV